MFSLRRCSVSRCASRFINYIIPPKKHGGKRESIKPVGLDYGKTQHCEAMEAGFSIIFVEALDRLGLSPWAGQDGAMDAPEF